MLYILVLCEKIHQYCKQSLSNVNFAGRGEGGVMEGAEERISELID